MTIEMSTLPENFRIISNPTARDGSKSSSADLFAKITYNGKEITESSVTGYEKWAVIHGLKMNLWRHETGDVSNKAVNSSAFLGMDEIEFCLPCSDVDLIAAETIAKGQIVDVIFMKTGNINGHSVSIESFEFKKSQIVSTFFFIQTAVTPSLTIRFKAKEIEIKRYSYDGGAEKGTAMKPTGQKVYHIDFVTNTSK